jgi:hypothetical protein
MERGPDEKIASDLKGVFSKLPGGSLGSNPHLATRVLAARRERLAGSVPRFWKFLALATSALSLALVAGFLYTSLRGPRFEAFVGRPFVVKMEVSDLSELKIARAEIHLPEGVYFDVGQPELRERRSLTLAWSNGASKEFVPIVLGASEEGTRKVTVLFFDEAGALVGEKSVEIRLKKGAGHV